jgi:hypothetical protein
MFMKNQWETAGLQRLFCKGVVYCSTVRLEVADIHKTLVDTLSQHRTL